MPRRALVAADEKMMREGRHHGGFYVAGTDEKNLNAKSQRRKVAKNELQD
jgi:hypothetical protein